MDILTKFEPHSSWIKLESKDYLRNGVTETTGAILLESYSIGTLYGTVNTMTLYLYGRPDDFLDDLIESYQELKSDEELQKEYDIKPIYWEKYQQDKMISVIKLISSPAVNIIDVFFEYDKKLYGFHTYIPGEEKQLKFSELYAKYPNIRHIIDEINKLKN